MAAFTTSPDGPLLADSRHGVIAQPRVIEKRLSVSATARRKRQFGACNERQLGVRGNGSEARAFASDHLVQYVDRMSGSRVVRGEKVATFPARAAK